MVQLLLTDALRAKLELVLPQLPTELASQISSDFAFAGDASGSTLTASTISHDRLVRVAKCTRGLGTDRQHTLASLLRLTDLHAPPLPKRVRSPELEAIMDKIRIEQEQRAYDEMTALSSSKKTALFDLGTTRERTAAAEDWTEVRQQVTAILNVLASMATVATGLWWVGGGRSYAARMMLAASGAVAIAAIEGFLYWRFFNRPRGRIASGATTTRRKAKRD